MPAKSSKSSFGRKTKSSTKSSNHVPLDVELKIWFKDPFRKNSKPHWVVIPGMEQLKYNLAKQWYYRLVYERFIKVIMILGVQSCVRVCYGGQIPTWFRKRILYSASDKTLNDYWSKCKRIITCFKLFEPEDAGFLLTEKSLLEAKKVSQLKFRTPEDLASECRFRNPIFNNVFSLLGLIESNIGEAPKGITIDNQLAGKQAHCHEIITKMKKMIHNLLTGNSKSILTMHGVSKSAILNLNSMMETLLN